VTELFEEPLAVSYDPVTLHEVYADETAVRQQIRRLDREFRSDAAFHAAAAGPDAITITDAWTSRLTSLGDLVVLVRGIGDLDDALTHGCLGVEWAAEHGTAAQQHTARMRLAHVEQWRGSFAESTMTFTELLAAAAEFGPVIEAFTHQHAGLNDYEQGLWSDAHGHFTRALAIRSALELPADQIEFSRLALAAAERRLPSPPS
jgi:hypothetical protein